MRGFEMYIKYEMIEGKLTQIYVVFDKSFQIFQKFSGQRNFSRKLQKIPGEVFPDEATPHRLARTETELQISS
jgi:hypothetical protein